VTAGRPGWLEQLAASLPGLRAEQITRFTRPEGRRLRESGVLVLFGEGPSGPDLVLIERAATLRSHAGQPAFPGGSVDPDDAGAVGAALREAQEEVGLEPASVEVFGQFPELFLPASGFLVTPVLAWWRAPHALRVVDVAEVAAVARVPLADLAEPANRWTAMHPSGYRGPAFDVVTEEGEPLFVWGFTAGVVDRLLHFGGWERPWDTTRSRELDPEVLALARRTSAPREPWLPETLREALPEEPGGGPGAATADRGPS
jgi:8-oxo-dGTP pyrophosphatase MutT (NUDIX family)